MSLREWALSALIVAFVGLKLAEGLLALESWPLSHVPMFAERQPPDRRPARRSIQALRGGTWFELRPIQLALNPAEVNRRLVRDPDPGVGCGELLRAFNARKPARLRIEDAYVRVVTLARPGTGQEDVVATYPCPLATAQP